MKNNRKTFITISVVVLSALMLLLLIGFFVPKQYTYAVLGFLFILVPLFSVPAIVVLGSIYYIILGINKVRKGQNTKKGILLILVGIIFLLFIVLCALVVFDVLKSGVLTV